MTASPPPAALLTAYGFAPGSQVAPIAGGLINATFLLTSPEGRCAIAQRLHPIFAPEVNLDIEAVTAHLARAGLETPRPLRTVGGDLWWRQPDGDGAPTWRLLTFVEGVTVHRMGSPAQAESAGELVGRFHRALADLDHEFVFTRTGVHDTAAHLARLRAAVADAGAGPEVDAGRALGAEILAAAAGLPPLGALPRRPAHGDLKVSNVLFSAADPERARCLIDLDTLGRQTIAYELGDALRSWCNPSGEDVEAPAVSHDITAAALRGYAAGARGLLLPDEVAGILPGLETVCVELAARFCVDVFDDRYFGWDSSGFSSRRAHNLVRARGQLALARDVARHRGSLAVLTAVLHA